MSPTPNRDADGQVPIVVDGQVPTAEPARARRENKSIKQTERRPENDSNNPPHNHDSNEQKSDGNNVDCIEECARIRYDQGVPTGAELPQHPTTPGATTRPGRRNKRGRRVVPAADLTLTVNTVTGPDSASLARTQYEAIREVLLWLQQHSPDRRAA